jgi:hypothetical protein
MREPGSGETYANSRTEAELTDAATTSVMTADARE